MILPYPVKIFDSVQYQINNHIWIYNTVYASWSPVNNSPCPGLLTWYNRVLIEDRRSLPCVPSRGGCGVPPVFTSCYYSYSLLTKLLRLALWQIDWLLALNISTMNIYWLVLLLLIISQIYYDETPSSPYHTCRELLCFCFLFSFKNKHNIHKWDKNNIYSIWQC